MELSIAMGDPMSSIPGVSKQGFFKLAAPAASVPVKGVSLVDMGGESDSNFRALAAGIIDNFIAGKRLKNEYLNKLLTQHFSYFSAQKSSAVGLVTPAERMQQLLKDVSIAELVRTIAFTLRQMAVDELNADPVPHLDVFFKTPYEMIFPEQMRVASAWLGLTGVVLAAKALEIPLEIQEMNTHTDLPRRLQFAMERGNNHKIVISFQEGAFIPYVANSNVFRTVKSNNRALFPVVTKETDRSADEIKAILDKEDTRFRTEFQKMQHRLIIMFEAEEITHEDLLDIYINNVVDKGQERRILLNSLFKVKRNCQMLECEHLPENTQDLVKAIALAVSAGNLSVNELFVPLENGLRVN